MRRPAAALDSGTNPNIELRQFSRRPASQHKLDKARKQDFAKAANLRGIKLHS